MKDFFGFKDQVFRRMLFRLALPVMLQQLVGASISLLDNAMIGGLGDEALAALLQASQITFLLFVFLFGITSATQAFTSQYWGQKNIAGIRKTLGLALLLGQVVGWGFFMLSFLAPSFVLSLFTGDVAVKVLGTEYLRIVGFSYPVIAMTNVYAAVLRGTENVRLPMTTSIIGLCCNGALNYILIYGHFGFPALGVRGAALATVIAQMTNFVLLMLLSKRGKKPTAASEYPMFRFGKAFTKQFASMAVPVFLNESLWALAQATIVLLYSWMGTSMAAAMGVFGTFEKLGFVAYMGIGNAAAVVCGKSIGANEEDAAQRYARRFLRIAPLFGFVSAVAVNALMPTVLLFYNISSVARAIVVNNVRIFALLSPVMAANHVLIVGVLRSGGDARYSLVLDAGLQWLLVVSGVALGAFVLGVPLIWVYAFIIPGEAVKLAIGRLRVISRKWIHHLTV